jgi:hypothetical protein
MMESRFKDDLKKTYSYDPESGLLFMGDKKVGWVNKNGYTYISTPFGKKVLAHRLAWLLYYGDWPKHDVDHVNRDRSDNRINNLRQLNRSQNLLNMDTPLLKGIYWDKSRKSWKSRTGRNGALKRFKTFCEAYKYRKEQYLEHSGD